MSEKLWVSPTSRAVLLAVERVNSVYNKVGLIVSENQVSYPEAGYTDWTSASLRAHLSTFKRPPSLARDHSSCGSLLESDCEFLDGLHLDPFKARLNDPWKVTLNTILACYKRNPKLWFEIGTEAAVMLYGPVYLRNGLNYLATNLEDEVFSRIRYAVVQTGSAIRDGRNVGVPDYSMTREMHSVCKAFGVQPKGHNFDYIFDSVIEKKSRLTHRDLCINLAPELGAQESVLIYSHLAKPAQEKWVELCLQNPNLPRWFSAGYPYRENPKVIIGSMGHYTFRDPAFLELRGRAPTDEDIAKMLETFLLQKLHALGA